MASIYDVDATELIEKAATELKKVPAIKPPQWASFVKTGMHKQRPPVKEDWWFTRSAAILRSIYHRGPIGVSKLRTKYGGKRDRGHKPEHFYKGSGAIIRKVCQQLEAAEFIKQTKIGVRKGRIVTPKGQSMLDKIATQILGKPVKPLKPTEAKPKKEKPDVPKATPEKPKEKAEKAVKAKPAKPEIKKPAEKPIKEKPSEQVMEEVKKKAEELNKKAKEEKEIKKVEELAKELQKKGTLREGKKKKVDVPTTHELAAKKKNG